MRSVRNWPAPTQPGEGLTASSSGRVGRASSEAVRRDSRSWEGLRRREAAVSRSETLRPCCPPARSDMPPLTNIFPGGIPSRVQHVPPECLTATRYMPCPRDHRRGRRGPAPSTGSTGLSGERRSLAVPVLTAAVTRFVGVLSRCRHHGVLRNHDGPRRDLLLGWLWTATQVSLSMLISPKADVRSSRWRS